MDESRKQFEEFAKNNEFIVTMQNGEFLYPATRKAWKLWQASRAAIEIKLDDKVMVEDDFDKGHNCAIDYCAEAIRAAGIKVKE